MSEKTHGFRASWNGEKLISSRSKDISTPKWFTEGLPKEMKLDGELWMGRGQYEKTRATLSSIEKNIEGWKEMKYVIFDLITPNSPYENRIEELKKLNLPSHVSVVDSKFCLERHELTKYLNEIVSNGGEGVVLTRAQSFYTPTQTKNRLHIKVTIHLLSISCF
jgi:DNA ligase-1